MTWLQSELEDNVGHSEHGKHNVCIVPSILEVFEALLVQLNQVIGAWVYDTKRHEVSE
jgi:hypothetical protein